MRREQDQLVQTDADYRKMKEVAEFELRREESLNSASRRGADSHEAPETPKAAQEREAN